MKFRAVMQDPQCMREFQNIIITLSKLTKEYVINISKEKVYLIANEESGSPAPMVWIEMAVDVYFPEYKFEGVSSTHPNILLSVASINMVRALAVLRHNARFCKLKLTKNQFPCLSVEVDYFSLNSEHSRAAVHDVPVTVIPRDEWSYYDLPTVPTCKLVLNVPPNRLIRALIDKIKNLSPTIIFHGTEKGELNLIAETEMATITTRFKHLEVQKIAREDDQVNDGVADRQNKEQRQNRKQELEANCAIDCRRTSIFFTSLQIPTMELSCGIDEERCIHFGVNVRPGVAINSILPAVCIT